MHTSWENLYFGEQALPRNQDTSSSTYCTKLQHIEEHKLLISSAKMQQPWMKNKVLMC